MARQKNYVNNEDLLEQMYISIDKERLTDSGLKMLMMLAQRTQRKLYYSCEDDKEQCLSEAYYDIWYRWNKFNPYSVRVFRFEMIKAGDEFKFYKDTSDRSTLRKCTALEDTELCINDGLENSYINLSSLNIDTSITREGAPNDMLPVHKRKMPTLVSLIDDTVVGSYDEAQTRIKVSYIEDGEEKSEYILKGNSVVRDPNPFSYFTSICINGFAKGFKELRPKKDKGKFISLDAGFGSDNGTDLYNA